MEVVGLIKRLWEGLGLKKKALPSLRETFYHFQQIIEENNRSLELMADLGEKLSGEFIFDSHFIKKSSIDLADSVYRMIYHLNSMVPGKYKGLFTAYQRIRKDVEQELKGNIIIPEGNFTIPYSKIDDGLEDAVGGKNAHLGIAQNLLALKIPKGFAITTKGFYSIIKESPLSSNIEGILSQWQKNRLSTKKASAELHRLVLSSPIPPALRKEVKEEIEDIKKRVSQKNLYFAIRSSCIGEDSEHTFAGIYKSFLGVSEDKIFDRYIEVLASTYSERALEYRRLKDISEREIAMAVACQLMINPRVSGVVYTLDPFNPEKDKIVIASIYGVGEKLVGGQLEGDKFFIERNPPHRLSGMEIVRKSHMIILNKNTGTLEEKPVNEKQQEKPSLTVSEINKVVKAALSLERYFKHPQDIEFAIDDRNELVILQTRPLHIDKKQASLVCDVEALNRKFNVIFQGKGDVVQEGIAMGQVYVALQEKDLAEVPEGSILVSPFSSPSIAKVIRRVTGIITDLGSPIGHLATLAREFRVPMVINTKIATSYLKTGQDITLNATENVVYDGYLKELCYYEFTEKKFEETKEYRLLKRIYKRISPLNLIDPTSRDFIPENCRSFHDLIRFIHEKAVMELIEGGRYQELTHDRESVILKLELPLELRIMDLEKKGDEYPKKEIDISLLSSLPLRSFIEGISFPGAWSKEPMGMDIRGFLSSIGKGIKLDADPRFIGQNLAVVSREYANISLRMGYHFSMIDTLASLNTIDNYIYFRFFGGMSDNTRRGRRASLISRLLTEQDFITELKGDLVIGRIKALPQEEILEKIFLLGVVVAYTRQLDIRMTTEEELEHHLKEFHRILLRIQ